MDLVTRSSELLSGEESGKLSQLICEFQEFQEFAKDDFDLGDFTAVQHKIDTGEAPPVKMRMRRTPVNFEKEEEEVLQKMLKAGVVQPSESDWASFPVLIRKKCGGVRWCIDYMALNKVTTKDVYPFVENETVSVYVKW